MYIEAYATTDGASRYYSKIVARTNLGAIYHFISMFDVLSFAVRRVNWMLRRPTALIHASVIASKKNPMYGAQAASVPRKRMRNCWIREPPDLPMRLAMTSMAAFPLVFCSASSGMYAISFVGSNIPYFVALVPTFCAVPTSTESMSASTPIDMATGSHNDGKRIREKKQTPGVHTAVTPQPNHARKRWPTSMRTMVDTPVA